MTQVRPHLGMAALRSVYPARAKLVQVRFLPAALAIVANSARLSHADSTAEKLWSDPLSGSVGGVILSDVYAFRTTRSRALRSSTLPGQQDPSGEQPRRTRIDA